jgi:glutathione S-transferase
MFLIGQYDSPFVRRVAIAMRPYGIKFEHKPWSTFGDGDKIAPHNPLRRVPTLVLDDGEALIESTAILDYLDELAREQDKVAGGSARSRPVSATRG